MGCGLSNGSNMTDEGNSEDKSESRKQAVQKGLKITKGIFKVLKVASNVTGIASNVTNIASTAVDIAANAGDIASNAMDIASGAVDIVSNVTDVASTALEIAKDLDKSNKEELKSGGNIAKELLTKTPDVKENDTNIVEVV